MLLLRAIVAFLALPALVGFAIPIWIGTSAGRAVRHWVPAVLLLSLGALLLLWCVREFYVAGRGTLAPWDPPQHLVTSGPYRISRNPMYIGVITILAGWCALWAARTLLIFALSCLRSLGPRADSEWIGRRTGLGCRGGAGHWASWCAGLRTVRANDRRPEALMRGLPESFATARRLAATLAPSLARVCCRGIGRWRHRRASRTRAAGSHESHPAG